MESAKEFEDKVHNDILKNHTPNDKTSLIRLLQDVKSTFSYLRGSASSDIIEILAIPLSSCHLLYEKIVFLIKQLPII